MKIKLNATNRPFILAARAARAARTLAPLGGGKYAAPNGDTARRRTRKGVRGYEFTAASTGKVKFVPGGIARARNVMGC